MRIHEIASAANGMIAHGDDTLDITSIEYDSRRVSPGGLFVALRGGYADGHQYLDHARQIGATAAMVERDGASRESLRQFDAAIEVPNTRAALAPVASAFYGHPSADLTTIGVTGTDGKTTTSYFIDAICRAANVKAGLIGTVGIRISDDAEVHSSRQTTPESLRIQRFLAQMRDVGTYTAIVEATSHGLMLHRLDHCDFDIAVVTNITHEHLDFHGTVENYRQAKGTLLRFVAASRSRGKLGVVVLNHDDQGARSIEHLAAGCHVVSFSASGAQEATVAATGREIRPDGSSFELRIGNHCCNVAIRLPGSFNIDNALAAAGAGHALDLDIDSIARGLESLTAVPGRMERVDEGQPFTIIVDYAHSPEAIRSILAEARRLSTNRVLVLFGSAGERDVEKRAIQGATAAELADFSVFTSEDPRFEDPLMIIEAIASGAATAGAGRGVDFECIEDRALAISRIIALAQPGDVIVLAGKGHERSMIYGNEFRPWNEAEIARSALRVHGYAAGDGRRIADS